LAQGPAKLIIQFRRNFERNSNSAGMVPGITWTELHPECRERNPLLLTMPNQASAFADARFGRHQQTNSCSSSTTTIVYNAHAASPHHHHHQRPPPPTIAAHHRQRQRHTPIRQENDPSATSLPKIDAAPPHHTGKEQRPGATSLLAMWQPDEQRTTSFVVVDN
jgi:hypothetical protein